MNRNLQYSTWVEVDLGAIENNIHQIRAHTGTQVMAIIKANAYGHGAVPVAHAALRAGAAWCGIARIEEALELRRSGVNSPMLLLGYTPPERYDEAIANRLSITVWTSEHLQIAGQAAARLGQPAHLHLKVDTGMSRLGVQVSEAAEMAHELANTPGTLFEGIFTHFARADEADLSFQEVQEHLFRELVLSLQASGLRPPLVHASNSAASLIRSDAWYDLVRPGISIYGLHPSAECTLPIEFRSALTWKAVLSHVKVLPAGRGLGYNHRYRTVNVEHIGTVPVGYADGFRRILGNSALVGGYKVPVVGGVCMDQIMVQLDQIPEAKPGDEVVLVGSQGEARLTAEEVARHWGTVNYEVTCGIGSRVPRIYS